MRFLRLSSIVALSLFSIAPKIASAQVVYAPGPVYVPGQVVQAPAGMMPRRGYPARSMMRRYYTPGYTSPALIRFRGGYVNGRNPYWPTGRNIPMAKPWLPAR